MKELPVSASKKAKSCTESATSEEGLSQQRKHSLRKKHNQHRNKSQKKVKILWKKYWEIVSKEGKEKSAKDISTH